MFLKNTFLRGVRAIIFFPILINFSILRIKRWNLWPPGCLNSGRGGGSLQGDSRQTMKKTTMEIVPLLCLAGLCCCLAAYAQKGKGKRKGPPRAPRKRGPSAGAAKGQAAR